MAKMKLVRTFVAVYSRTDAFKVGENRVARIDRLESGDAVVYLEAPPGSDQRVILLPRPERFEMTLKSVPDIEIPKIVPPTGV